MNLSKSIIQEINPKNVEIPQKEIFDYPEKVLQFGTGVLLRGLCDYFIDKANKSGIFKGRVVVVKSTGSSGVDDFSRQDNLYTVCVRGIEGGIKKEENIINASISRVITAKDHWEDILSCAANPEMQVVISNTTEVGLVAVKDNIHASPPESFPGKLLAFLYQRYKIFGADPEKGMVIIPTELIPGNGDLLLSILTHLARENQLEEKFIRWLKQANAFCNSLVDRIVPGKLPVKEQEKTEQLLGYHDELMIMCEIYRLWAVEVKSERAKKILSFSESDPGLILAPDIQVFRDLKLRILNGSHTLSCGLAHLSGFTIVREAMNNSSFANYVEELMTEEIIPVITNKHLTSEMAEEFAKKVNERFRNPYLEHKWLSITMQYASKMHMRDLPLLIKYYEMYSRVPSHMALGWAAHLLFMKSTKGADGQYYGEVNGKSYLVNDNQAAHYAELWEDPANAVARFLADKTLWEADLNQLPGFTNAVAENLEYIQKHGAAKAINHIQAVKSIH